MAISIERFGFNTVTMGGELGHKLDCMKAAGFSGVELWARDLINHPAGVEKAAQLVEGFVTVAMLRRFGKKDDSEDSDDDDNDDYCSDDDREW